MAADGTAYDLGIDLGTTYVAAGILEQGRPEIITLGDRSAAVPSVLFFREDGDVLTGESARRRGLGDPTRVVREFKRRVGDTTPIVVGQTPYPVDVLMAKLLRFVYDAVVERQGGQPRSIVVTHPANWGPYKIDVLEQAVRLADIGEASTITEPVAAAIHYAAAERLQPGQTVAVYDLGGGTFDAAVLRKTDEAFTVLGEVEGIERLGGIDFDEAVFQHVVRFCESSLAELDMDDPAAIQALARLRQECTDAKEVLSTDTDVTIQVVLPNSQSEIRLTRAEFEAMIRPLLQQTVEALRRSVRSAGVDPQELSAVLLVGGSSRIPLIAEMVGAELGRPIAVDRHPKHTVALGAAISAGRSEEAPAPQVDDWFRTDPTTSGPTGTTAGTAPAGAAAGAVAAGAVAAGAIAARAVAAGAVAAGEGDDPFSMFPLKDGQRADRPVETSAAAVATSSPAPSPTAAPQPVAEAAPAIEAPTAASQANHAVISADTEPSPAERIGTSPIQFATTDIPASEGPAPEGRVAVTPHEDIRIASHRPATPANDATILAHRPAEAMAPAFGEHPFQAPPKRSTSGARLLVMAGVALGAVLLLGGGAWALTRTGEPTAIDPTDEEADGDEVVGELDGTQGADGDRALTAITDRTGSTIDPVADGGNQTDTDGHTVTTRQTTDNQGTTATTTETTKVTTETTHTTETTATTSPPTTEAPPKKIVITGGPRVNTRNDRSFQFDYTTNDVCGTGSFTVTEKATGRSVGSFRGADVCYGPRHGGFPGHSSFPGFSLKPGTTYKVSISVRGTASDGTRTAGSGTARTSFEVTTTGTATTTPPTTEAPPTTTDITTGGTTGDTTGDTAAMPPEEAAGPVVPSSTLGG